MDIVFIFLIFGAIVTYYFYLMRNYNYWRAQGIPCLTSVLPGLGNMWPVVSCRMSIIDLIQWIYESYPGCSMIGFYDKTTPALVIREPELVKTVIQTNFKNFSENLLKIDPDLDPLFAKNAFLATDETWLRSRKRLLHAFSGRRLKELFSHTERTCKKLEDYLDQNLRHNNGAIELELKDLSSRYISEAAASTIFSMEGFCFENKVHSKSFVAMGKAIFELSFFGRIAQALYFNLPQFNKIMRLSITPKHVDLFFRNIVKQLLLIKRQEKVRRNDLFHLLADMEEIDAKHFDESLLTADIFAFFASGFETTSFTLCMVTYQLARHPRVQQKLRDEVVNVLATHDGKLTYQSLKEMQYMDKVINESQRLYSSVGTIGKICTKEFELKGSDGLCCRVQPGTRIFVPINGLHRDSKYWPAPDVFDPDRFATDKQANIQKYAYLPFGEGPRICPGKSVSLLQMKACLATLVSKYDLEASPKIIEPLKMTHGGFLLSSVDGLWINLKRL